MQDRKIQIAWYGKHYGEEPPLVGSVDKTSRTGRNNFAGGAGTIFFSHCNLRCVYCQNFQISQQRVGKMYNIEALVEIMLELQSAEAVCIDLVTPTPWWRRVKEAIRMARNKGLILPVVWNSNAYETLSILQQMQGLVDIYLPDFKYADDRLAVKYSHASHYVKTAESAIKEMYRQVGKLKINKGVAVRGIIVRHLILPGHIENTFAVLEKIAAIDGEIHISLMSQFQPVYYASEFPEINRAVSDEERRAVEIKMMELGLKNGWIQAQDTDGTFLPDFTQSNPFQTERKME